MRASELVGRTIVAVEQRRKYDETIRATVMELVSIELDNGRRIAMQAHDDGSVLFVTGRVLKTK